SSWRRRATRSSCARRPPRRRRRTRGEGPGHPRARRLHKRRGPARPGDRGEPGRGAVLRQLGLRVGQPDRRIPGRPQPWVLPGGAPQHPVAAPGALPRPRLPGRGGDLPDPPFRGRGPGWDRRARLRAARGLVWDRRPRAAAGAAAAAGVLLVLTAGPPAGESGTVFARDTAYHRITVADEGRIRYLRLDNYWQSARDLDAPLRTVFPYSDYLHLPVLFDPGFHRVL